MKKRIFWLFVAVMIAGGAVYFARQKQTATPPVTARESPITAPTLSAVVPVDPAPVVTLPLRPPPAATTAATPSAPQAKPRVEPPEVPIQDGATIDFSIGAPVVRSGGEDKEALERSLQEMKEAVKDVKFNPKK